MNFLEYISDFARAGKNPRGDFIRDARSEISKGRFPIREEDESVEDYMRRVCFHIGGGSGRHWAREEMVKLYCSFDTKSRKQVMTYYERNWL